MKNQVDVVMIIETNIKWIMKSIDIMKNKFKKLGKSLELIIADSKVHNTIDLDWL